MLELIDEQLGLQLLDRFGFLGLQTLNTDVIFAPSDNNEALRIRHERYQEDKLNFISYYRTNISSAPQRLAGTAGAFNNIKIGRDTNGSGTYYGYKAVPVQVTYEIIYWSVYKLEINRFLEKYFFWKYEQPTLSFTIGDDEVPVNLYIRISDPTEVYSNWFEQGRYFKVQGYLDIEGLVINEMATPDITKITLDIYNKDSSIQFSHMEVMDNG